MQMEPEEDLEVLEERTRVQDLAPSVLHDDLRECGHDDGRWSEPRPWRAEPPEDEREQHRADEGRRRSEDHVVRAAQDVEPAGSYIFEEYSDLVVDLLHRPS